MNVLSLFDGISCGRVALDRAGIKYDKYYASEIDKYAIKIALKNYPDTIELGDITKIKATDLPKIDLIIGGSPCQGFSFAGKGLNFNDQRSKLFFEFVRLVDECKPKYFLLENVIMLQKHIDVISLSLKCFPIEINSSLVSAQNRRRLYWTNIPMEKHPENKHIYLKDILESGVAETKKSYCIDSHYNSGTPNYEHYKKFKQRQIVWDKPKQLVGGSQSNRVYAINGKSVSLKSEAGGKGAKTGLYAVALRNRGNGKQPEIGGDKANSLTSVETDSMVLENMQIRKLTPIECERLQTLPDNYTQGISNSQRYKCLGNGWTVDVIAHILQGIKSGEVKPILYQENLIYDDKK